ncbi:hypothetical protein EMEDMD4_590024 [Sinorhizobium medicae]|uniref:Uncharacterized protein n=1 Tax=Sinorhizobium medicae TaxID=110321 RepID=A0A508X3J2_9HYPH|nr:hypothetical protein EMEDMD4_590024 [Sinorhizobium medicae]
MPRSGHKLLKPRVCLPRRVNLLSDALPMLILQLDALVLQKFLMILDIILYTGQIANTSTTSAPAASSQSYSEALLRLE